MPAPLDSDAYALRAWLLAGKRIAERRGIDANALLREVGLDLGSLNDPLARHSAARGLAFWQRALQAAGDELLGLDVALESVPLTLGALGYALMASENLGQMYARLARYAHVVTDAAEICFDTSPEGVGRLAISGDQHLLASVAPPTAWSLFDYAMLSVVRGSRLLYGRDFAPLELRLQRPRPKDAAKFEKLFACTPLYGCPDNAVLLDAATLARPLSFANPHVVQASEAVIDQQRAAWQAQATDGLARRVAALLPELLPGGEPTQHEVARRLGLAPRRLQRGLAEAGTNFRAVLADTRHRLAVQHLRAACHSVGEVAFLLGFSEVSAFTRAFKRWTGHSPRRWRADAAGGTAGTPGSLSPSTGTPPAGDESDRP